MEAALHRPRDLDLTRADVAEMRALMARERPPSGPWDLKLAPGGLVDVEFGAQLLQLLHAARGGPLRTHTGEALAALAEGGVAPNADLGPLAEAWRFQSALNQLLRLALPSAAVDAEQPARFRERLAQAVGEAEFDTLHAALASHRAAAHAVFERTVSGGPPQALDRRSPT